MKNAKLTSLAELAVSRNISAKPTTELLKAHPKTERVTFSFDVDEFHILAKAIEIYRTYLDTLEGDLDTDFVEKVDTLQRFFLTGEYQ